MKEADPRAWQQTVRGRVLLAAALFAVWAVAIEARLVWLQVYRHEADARGGEGPEGPHGHAQPAARRHRRSAAGALLAISVDAESVNADPSKVEYPADLAERVCWALGDCSAEERGVFARRLSKKDRRHAFLRRQVSLEEAARVAAQKLPGIFIDARAAAVLPEPGARGARARVSRHGQHGARRHRAVLQLEDQRHARAA